ncbi:MAG: hydrogenase expression/formation protein HypE [Veillonellaceae bacterium]|nr:hydrogenase expression/formation protein HypE [Veillonellaceae bacterium]MDD6924448.1 hydrogenase expression/formation protein HypE [Veillonellaceae bacterium]
MDKMITLAHGGGGRKTSELINNIFRKHLGNEEFTSDDAAVLEPAAKKIAFTTDGFIVTPWRFPGGNIGKLSICGTVNDLTCMGAHPKWLSCACVIEEGTPVDDVEEIVRAMAETAIEAGVHIVCGDTKVAGRGQVDHMFITTTGIGELQDGICPKGSNATRGDAVIVTNDIGRHGCTILLSRDQYGIDADIKSDCAPLWGTVSSLFTITKNLHTIRDATRGGVGTVLYELARESNKGIRIDRSKIPVDPAVAGVCGMLGLDPLYLACEGTMVILAPMDDAGKIVEKLHSGKYSRNAAVIGTVTDDEPGKVFVKTDVGTEMILPEPGGELLPRIC